MSKNQTTNRSNERYIVTSALPYINGVKHIGNLIGSLLPADVYTRYLKLRGKDVIYICGTDDHGTPAELSALNAKKPVDEYVKEMYQIQKDIYQRFGINFDYFGQTSDQENHEITKEIFLGLHKNGYIQEQTSMQLFSIDDNRYLPDRYVKGTCPHCGYEEARGDQCESCTTLLNPSELLNPRSTVSGSTNIEMREVRHLYIDLPKLQPKVEEWIEEQTHWPATSLSIARKWLKEGLRTRSITRNLDWGIKVPLDGYDDIVFYVWFDAPIGYISITKKWAHDIVKKPELFDYYWKSKETKLIQFMGIDNVPFHSIIFPCSLIGADLGYPLVHTLKAFQWLTYEKGKFSTSQNRGIFTDTALELFPPDYWRYYTLLIAPERQDTSFQWKGFQSAINNDLNNQLGNLVNRFVTFCVNSFDGKVPEFIAGDREIRLKEALNEVIGEYQKTFDQIEFQKPLKALRKFWQECNTYFQEARPWVTVKDDIAQTAATIGITGHCLRSIAILFAPFAPFTAEKIFTALGYNAEEVHKVKWEEIVDWSSLVGRDIPELKSNLFTKISNKEIDELIDRFGSEQKKIKDKGKKAAKKEKQQPQSKYIQYEDFAKVKLISAKVVAVKKHPKADSLLVITVDDGTRQDRTICAGIAEFYKPKDLVGKTVIIVDNLKPRKLRGIKSEGMLLTVEDDEGISILQPDRLVNGGHPVQ